MKYVLILALCITLCDRNYAQKVIKTDTSQIKCRCCISRASLLLILKHHGRQFMLDTMAFTDNLLKPTTIKKFEVVKTREALDIYGFVGKNGAVLVTLDEQKYPKLFKQLKKYIKAL